MTAPESQIDGPTPAAEWSCIFQEADLLRLMTCHERLARLCDLLEACADALPMWPTEAETERLRVALIDFVERKAEGDTLVAKVLGCGLQDPLATALVRHVDARQTGDLIHAEDLIAALEAGPVPNGRISAETLGYMLRCFFAAGRQSMVLEEFAVLALGRDHLTATGESLLVDSLCRRAS
ncbi:hypothetical protein [Methylobacterium sp.]|jgi:hypothetical protein|uniref:hypothetical protein n=1 Tax=Methylobacterium sp. TaxID=409 RepID=UPI000C477FF6|nr:hypothetical protein [Methylobacterium sp.]MBP33136.1 hypothetical protein [Methylobacterium sp.]